MDQLTKTVADLAASVNQINLRIDTIENGPTLPNPRQQDQPQPVPENVSLPEFDVQTCYNAIKSSLAAQRIPQSLVVPSDKTGIRRSDQPVHNVIVKVSKFTETIIKIIQSPDYTPDDEPKRLQDILTVSTALIQVLQEESTALVVQGSFDDGVAKFFRSLQRTNNFSAESLENLRAAASIAAVYRPQGPQHQRGRGGYHQRGQGYSGQWRSGFRRRGGQGRGQGFAGATPPPQHRDDE